ncbi:MAG: cell wall-binding repeat-containing protein [Actinomycetota bacterium]|nr:cell wall-binding repeat-containing protein [Actinomycetota bacterium]
MSPLTARSALAAVALSGALLTTGCGRGSTDAGSGVPAAPPLGTSKKGDPEPAVDLGFPAFATKNTTRVAASDPVAVAAGVARSVFPGLTPESRPDVVALVDKRDWRTALAASALMSNPVGAPLLLSDASEELPAASQKALDALDPKGSKAAGGAEVIRIGSVPRPDGRKTTDIPGGDPFALAQALDAFQAAARGKTSDRVIIVSADDPRFAAPAAAYAAKSGDPILFARKNQLPAATRAAIRTHQQPKIYVLGPTAVIGTKVTAELRKLGSVKRLGDADPVRNAIAFATFSETDFGWGVVDPGHGVVFSREVADPALAAAAAPLSASGTYGPMLLVGDDDIIDPPLATYLKSIQPGYRTDPVRGVYNHGWLVGDSRAMTPKLQTRLDTLLEIMPETTTTAKTP